MDHTAPAADPIESLLALGLMAWLHYRTDERLRKAGVPLDAYAGELVAAGGPAGLAD